LSELPPYTEISKLRMTRALLASLARMPSWLSESSVPLPQASIGADFLGVNVAPSDDAAVDDYILQRLSELGTRQVRMDFSYSSPQGPAQRLLDTLLANDFRILLNLFPPLEEAAILAEDTAARARWSDFLHATFDRYGSQVEIYEIGNTPNRGRWSGFNSVSIMAAWQVAAKCAEGKAVQLAGPNVSDFEPVYNAAYLDVLGELDITPALHTDNLFVERVVEPEAYDHRVLGRGATKLIKLNLIKKARALYQIGKYRGSGDLICTYTCWTAKRLGRRNAWPEQKAVDYQIRYLVLAAASGALRRIYWGPLICNRDGLIDDSSTDYPVIDQVSFYEKVKGGLDQFSINNGFHSLAFANRSLAGSQLTCLVHQPNGLSLFRLDPEGEPARYVSWCRDAQIVPMAQLLNPQQQASASFFGAMGEQLPPQTVVTEHPVFFTLPEGAAPNSSGTTPDHLTDHLSSPQYQSTTCAINGWRGALMMRTASQQADLALVEALSPEKIQQLPELAVMRDVRNRLWNVADPREQVEQVTVKLNRVKGLKRLTYRFRPSKGRRHWNNACQMLRRGVATPLPVAFYENPENSGIQPSWYLCEFIPQAFCARDVYAAFRNGSTEYRGYSKTQWFDILSEFVCNMHNKQIVHRDLSAGNLLLSQRDSGEISPMLIDIGRANIWSGPGSRVKNRHRLQDLIRICYKLNWQDREQFIRLYEKHNKGKLGSLWRIPFHYYDNKQRFKKAIKGKRRKRTPGK
jgi:Lipopolysaccharide kinase (Kdo/WaaP) family